MSSFWGYLLEAVALTVLWLWWTVNTYAKVIRCQAEGKEFTPRLSFPWPGTKLPVEVIYKIVISGCGFLATVFDDGLPFVDSDGNYRKMATVISMSIYGIFLVHSIVELLLLCRVPLVKDADYITGALGFLWYALATFYRARDFMSSHASVAVMVMTFPMYPLLTIGVSLLVEAASKRGHWSLMMRVICLGVLATWDWNAAFILHSGHAAFPGREPSNWDMSDHSNTAFIGAAFGDHVCFHLLFHIVAYIGVAGFLRARHGLVAVSKD